MTDSSFFLDGSYPYLGDKYSEFVLRIFLLINGVLSVFRVLKYES